MSKLPLHVEAAAEADAAEIADYVEREEGRGARFLADLAHALERVEAAPEALPPVPYEPRARSVRIGRSDYRAYFLIEPERVRVVAIGHARRQPRFWRGRLG